MLFAGKTKSGSQHLWPRWWCFLFGGTYRQKGSGGYGTVYSIPTRIRRYYRDGFYKHESLLSFIWDQGPYARTGLWRRPGFLARWLCRHPSLSVHASTAAERSTPLNVDIGVTIRCDRCGRTWTADFRAGCVVAWGNDEACKSLGE